jgi:hypothetical protein
VPPVNPARIAEWYERSILDLANVALVPPKGRGSAQQARVR